MGGGDVVEEGGEEDLLESDSGYVLDFFWECKRCRICAGRIIEHDFPVRFTFIFRVCMRVIGVIPEFDFLVGNWEVYTRGKRR